MQRLVEDPYGNYLVSYVLKLEDAGRNQRIFRMIAGNFIKYSKQKFSSNVIEQVSSKIVANFVVSDVQEK